ncbi:MAG: flagellar motor protein MotB [Kiloniellaceae bacterium]
MAGVAEQPGQRQSNSNIIALLSLKILLLAFFILLNALSSFEEERRTAVVESVRQAFQGLLPAERNVRADPAASDIFEGSESIIDSLNQLFGDNLPLVERQDSSAARTLQVDLPLSELFADQGDDLQPEGAETLRLIAGVLTDPRFARQNYRVDVLYGLEGRSSGIEGNRTALLRAGALVRDLEQQGLPSARLSAGLLPGFPGQVRFHFTIEAEPPAPAAGGQG